MKWLIAVLMLVLVATAYAENPWRGKDWDSTPPLTHPTYVKQLTIEFLGVETVIDTMLATDGDNELFTVTPLPGGTDSDWLGVMEPIYTTITTHYLKLCIDGKEYRIKLEEIEWEPEDYE